MTHCSTCQKSEGWARRRAQGKRTLVGPGSLVGVALVTAVACDMDPRPPSYLDDLRVLAIEASPLEAGPGEQVTLVPTVFARGDDPLVDLSWSFCPVTLGSLSGYACVLDACELPLESDPDGRVRASPFGLASQCPLAGGTVPDVIDSLFRLTTRSASGQERIGLFVLPLWTSAAPPSRNRPPVIERIEVDGHPLAGLLQLDPVAEEGSFELRVLVDPSSLDEYQDTAGRDRVEEPLVSFYASAGRFEYDRDIGTDLSVTWTAERLEEGQVEAQLFVVVRDLRGGQVAAGPMTVPLLL